LVLLATHYKEVKFKRDKKGGACDTHMGEKRCAYKIFVGKPGGKRPPRRSRNSWDDNIQKGA
jgi:hypothetical protein